VGSLTEGSVRRSSNRVRITIKLIDTQSEEQLWGDTFDRELRDIFSVQTEIAEHVAQALAVRLGVVETSAILRHQTSNVDAHALYLKGRYQWNSRSEVGVNKAIKYFEEAIARDPKYALAYVGLADCYSILGYYGYRRPKVVYPRARELAERALALDDNLAEAHASIGETLMQHYLDWARAGAELDRALELNPSYATAHMWRATHHVALGRFEESLAEVRKAMALDPLSMIILSDEARDLYLAGRHDEAIDQYRKALAIDADFPIAHKGLAEVYAQKGMYDEAIGEIEAAIALSGRSLFILDDLGYIYARAGLKEKAHKVLEDLDTLSKEEFVPPYGIAAIHAGLGDKEGAMDWLEKAYEDRSFLIYLKVDPIFLFLKKEIRFEALLAKMGL
jgi:tetratricopeptide (TPR) repeat protein